MELIPYLSESESIVKEFAERNEVPETIGDWDEGTKLLFKLTHNLTVEDISFLRLLEYVSFEQAMLSGRHYRRSRL